MFGAGFWWILTVEDARGVLRLFSFRRHETLPTLGIIRTSFAVRRPAGRRDKDIGRPSIAEADGDANVPALRHRPGITRERFATVFRIALRFVLIWKQGRSKPDRVAVALPRIIVVDSVEAIIGEM